MDKQNQERRNTGMEKGEVMENRAASREKERHKDSEEREREHISISNRQQTTREQKGRANETKHLAKRTLKNSNKGVPTWHSSSCIPLS